MASNSNHVNGSKMKEIETDVLIVGAGVVGLSLAALLAEQGIRVFAVAKHSGTSPSPRAHVTNQRTMEVFRDMGIEKRIQASGTCLADVGNLVMATSLTGMEIGRYSCYGGGDHQLTDFAKASPCQMWNASQNLLEPVLLVQAREKGADIRFYHELVDIEQSDECVVGRVRERTSGAEYTMDLARYVAHRPACIYWMLQPGDEYWVGSGTCILKRPWDEWVVNRQYNAADGEPDMSDESIIAHARKVLGIPDSLPVRVKHKGKWQVNHVVANEYQRGRIFLAGDAAHRHPPSSGLGSNTCVQDAYNLAWKLALVIKGKASAKLLESFHQERQPVGQQVVDHAIMTLHDMAAIPKAFGFVRGQSREEGFASLNELFSDADGAAERRKFLREQIELGNRRSNALGVQLGHRYASSCAVVDDGTPFPAHQRDPILYYEATTHPGAYVPHAWLELDQKRISILDVFEQGKFGLVVGIGGELWKTAAATVSKELDFELPVYDVGHRCTYDDVLGEWSSRREISDRGALLVRPDRHIAWRSAARPQDPTAALRSALRQVLSLE
ncbi:hypothetical protein FZEAL_10020 [Fusarium zealandicum]|uniref:FAD-binding domain-containing protein n=1 Tax=Fusarium zealandicum TaxID=1053134 RepID=A0A8H4U6N0_9HYPO|nr:hypothetical protein FZEAL_10020 [Fusarium zealandicum]